jgi:hypothetical protein
MSGQRPSVVALLHSSAEYDAADAIRARVCELVKKATESESKSRDMLWPRWLKVL